jgi:hypothetical protein
VKHEGHEYGENDENQIYGPSHAPRMKWSCAGCKQRNDHALQAQARTALLPCVKCKRTTRFTAADKTA